MALSSSGGSLSGGRGESTACSARYSRHFCCADVAAHASIALTSAPGAVRPSSAGRGDGLEGVPPPHALARQRSISLPPRSGRDGECVQDAVYDLNRSARELAGYRKGTLT